ncbi:anthranilate phosphoribosyltransferase [bacterium]|nr:anthranilate phosphoribosyltransferase [bacterium]
MLIDHVKRLIESGHLSADEAYSATSLIIAGAEEPAVVSSYLTALRLLGETGPELAGTARALREHAVRVQLKDRPWVDTCGTGGSPVSTFNISTAAAIVASACGVPVAKHGNRSFSSSSGSADVLTALGVNVQAPPEVVARSLEEIGLGFLFAPLWHPAMKHAAPVRQAIRFRTIFNLVGPLANPVGLAAQIIGVGQATLLDPLAEAIQRLNIPRAAVVWGEDGTDEVSLSKPTHVRLICGNEISSHLWQPTDFGVAHCDVADLAVSSPKQSAQMIRDVLAGKPGGSADVVAANVSALLWVANQASSLIDGMRTAQAAITSGKAALQLRRLVEITQGH